ncbi:tail fiber assembly protein [Variovorax sp. NFACC27]|uniref:tail fiber assembly protein n=1 Tax=unclassified Variovorax TaxID=663243 RepID=UPI000897FBC7|nr:Phage tail assembly chaperone protein [Variovorax sp. NFACC28]SEG89741.1 Phage tail assembly chaperone protein [Variovorax sp. NFACC29]SFD39812.1 Phage tail assembly chaperone protein [Variovorax sp. NFACC26]SFG42184.1 Phage tail assembly chaperone protein [Variovorax sp. NFACC27]
MRIAKLDRIGIILELRDFEMDPDTGVWPEMPAGFTTIAMGSDIAQVGGIVRQGMYFDIGNIDVPAIARADRTESLKACDWTQLPDVPEGVAEIWTTYRQALRDVPQQTNFPTAIDWPVAPV